MENKLELVVIKLREIKENLFDSVIQKLNGIQTISKKIDPTDLKIYNISYYLYKQVQAKILTTEQDGSLKVFFFLRSIMQINICNTN